MEYWHLIYEVPAIISAATIVTDILPFSLDRRYVALLVFVVSLIVLNLPAIVSLALGLVLLVSVINKYLGVSFSAKEPVRIPFGKYRTTITAFFRESFSGWRVNTVPTEFLTRAYEPEEPEQLTVVKKFVPDLPGA